MSHTCIHAREPFWPRMRFGQIVDGLFCGVGADRSLLAWHALMLTGGAR